MSVEINPKTKMFIYYLSYGGLLPFVFSLAGIYFGNSEINSFSIIAFISYSAVILSFVGAVHWGFLLQSKDVKRKGLWLSISVMPGLVAWLALISPLPVAFLIFTLAYPLLFLYEKLSELNRLLPAWYRVMRLRLTIIVTLLMVAASISLL